MAAKNDTRLPRQEQRDIVTRRMLLSDIKGIELTDIAKDLLSGIDEPQLIRKGISVDEKTQYDDEDRTSVDYITTKTIDRDGEIVIPNGAMLDHYRKNPVVLFVHDYKNMPVGKALWIKADKNGLIAKTKYSTKGKGNEVWEYRKEGFPMAKSIGFIPLGVIEENDFGSITDEEFKSMQITKEEIQGASRIFPKWLMLEYSDVPVPSNPDALQLAISKGILCGDDLQRAIDENAFVVDIENTESVEVDTEEKPTEDKAIIINKPETTEDYHHIPIRDKSDFVSDSFRTITLSEGQGIKALIGKLKSDPDGKTEVATYLFSTSEWTMEEARAWVDKHKDEGVDTIKAIIDPSPEQNMLSERYGKEILDIKDKKDLDDLHDIEEMPVNASDSDINKTIESPTTENDESARVLYEYPFVVKSFSDIEKADGAWNQYLPKTFNIESVNIDPSSKLYDIASKWFDCHIKEIYMNTFSVPSALMGTFLAGLEKTFEEYKLVDTRNFRNSESPPVYETIKLTADKEKDFLVNGIQFYEKEGSKFIITREAGWYGMVFVVMSKFELREESKGIVSKTKQWVKDNNFLKGQKFDLSGAFLKTNDEIWDSIFLNEKNFKAVKSAFDAIEGKGVDMPNRGVMLIGPPGTGKTMSCRVAMNLTKNTFIWVSARDFRYSGSVGGMSYAFSLAKELAPTILCVEDIDNWLSGQTVDILKSEMDGIVKSNGVVTFLTSNYPERIPEALIDRPGRFHDILNFDHPNNEIKARMINSWAIGVSEKSCSNIIKNTVGFSGAHMYELVSFAKRLMEDDADLTIDAALELSLNKIIEQRELIQVLRGEKGLDDGSKLLKLHDDEYDGVIITDYVKKDFTNEGKKDMLEIEDSTSVESIEKAGRVLSKNTRTILGITLKSLENSVSALKEFMEAVDKDEKYEPVVDIEDENAEEKRIVELDSASITSAFKEVLSELFSQGNLRINTDELIGEGIRKAKGEIF